MSKIISTGAELRVIGPDGNVSHIETTDGDFVMNDKDLVCILECGCHSHDCSGRAYVFADGFGSHFWVHDANVKHLPCKKRA
jgi:hypothetical protein